MAGGSGLVSVSLVDDTGVTAAHNIFVYIDDTVETLANTITTLQAYLPVLDAVTDAKITKASFTLTIPLPGGLKAAPVADSNVEETFLANFGISGQPYKYGIDVPAVAQAMVTDGKIDLANVNFEAWRLWIVSLHGHFTVVSKFILAITGLLDVLISFRKHRKAQQRRSIVNG